MLQVLARQRSLQRRAIDKVERVAPTKRCMDVSNKQLLEAAPDAMLVIDQTGILLFANEQAESLFGYARDELIGSSVDLLLPERFRKMHLQHRQRFSASPGRRAIGEKREVSLFGRRKDGSEFDAEISLNTIVTDEGAVIVSAVRDVSPKLAESDKHKQLLDSAPDAMVVVDAAGNIVLVNAQTELLFGYAREELIGNSPEMLIPERYREAHVAHRSGFQSAPVARPMSNGPTLYGRRKNGDEFPAEVSLSPIRTVEGTLVASTIRDVSAHIEAQAALTEAKEIAEHSTAAKSRFLAAASHDLRQPLQSLGLYLSVMKGEIQQPHLVSVATKMQQSLDTMSELLDALLDISKLETGTIAPQVRDIRLAELVDRIVTDNIQQAERKGLHLELACVDCVVRSDPALLQRIIENFVCNAIRYTDDGRVEIACNCSNDTARISVTDTGIGIPKVEVEKIFEEYYQLDNPVRDRSKGLGLGLSIVKHISRLLDHRLSVDSTPGEGSTFTVDVPIGDVQSLTAEKPPPVQVPHACDFQPTVLLVDDAPAILDATTMLLQSAGIEVHCALNRDDALALLAAGVRPDIIISDYRLPKYNGVETVRSIRDESGADLPTIIMTGDTSADEIEAASLASCTILHKPVNTDRLISLIHTLSEPAAVRYTH